MVASNQNIRLAGLGAATIPDNSNDIQVEHDDTPDPDAPEVDDKGNILKIEHGDGSITISLDGHPVLPATKKKKAVTWFSNLAEKIPEAELGLIASDLMRGIEDDKSSRKDWIEARADGIKLLGLKLEVGASSGAAGESAPVEGQSRVRHPLLLEAVLRFQANARSEMLPTDGPVKIRNDDNNAELNEDELANDFEKDLNHFLTVVATEFYPDTDRMLLMLGFGGTSFKKVYNCPLRNRPVSETVDADDLIVNESASDIENARRVTHKIMMRPSVVKRMQIIGAYRKVELGAANIVEPDAAKEAKLEQQGVSPSSHSSADDRDRELYECYCELDIKGYEHMDDGSPSGLPVPYRVTIDVTSEKILSIVRNYNEDDQELPTARDTFVKYTFVPGFGFYDIGLVHILGNTTNAITAAWRELLDAGMYANFPGFLMADTGARQNTNIFRIPPGGGATVKTGGMPINQAVMPLPYQGPSQALMALVNDMATTGQRIGGTAEQQVGEGNAEAPVGTTLAMIEQAQKVLNAVHKRMHASQAKELQMLVECFKDNPRAFWQRKGRSGRSWDEAAFHMAVNNYELVPQADPNTASHGQRVMKIMALKQLQAASPDLYDKVAVDTISLKTIGFSNPQQFFSTQQSQDAEPPEVTKEKAELAIKKEAADSTAALNQAKAQEIQAKIQQGAYAPKPNTPAAPPAPPQDTQADMIMAQAKMVDAQSKMQSIQQKTDALRVDDSNHDEDRSSRERIQLMQLAKDVMLHPEEAAVGAKEVSNVEKKIGVKKGD